MLHFIICLLGNIKQCLFCFGKDCEIQAVIEIHILCMELEWKYFPTIPTMTFVDMYVHASCRMFFSLLDSEAHDTSIDIYPLNIYIYNMTYIPWDPKWHQFNCCKNKPTCCF
jgi:hypothetical protein